MERIKNLVNPGSKHDDQILYGSGQSDDPVVSGSHASTSGQGSHLSSSNATGNDPISSSTEPPSTSSYRGSNTAGNDPILSATEPSSNTGYGSNTTGTDHHRGIDQPTGYSDTKSGVNDPYSTSRPQGTLDDAATTASIKSGIPGQAQSGSLTGSPGTHDALGTNKPLPNEPASGLSGISSSTTAGPHSSSLANKADPRVDSDLDGSRGLGSKVGDGHGLTGSSLPDRSVGNHGYGSQVEPTQSSTLGRDAALGAGAIGAGSAAAHHHNRDPENAGLDSGRSFPLGGNQTTKSDSTYPSHSTGLGASTTAGPHSSDLANKADPRIDSDLDGSRGLGNTGYGSGTGPTTGSDHRGTLGHDAGLGSGAGTGVTSTTTGSGLGHGPESWKHEHSTHGHTYEGDPCGPEESATGAPHFTTGPHATDTANRLDPHVASDITAPTGSTNPSTGSTLGTTSHGDHHLGRDAALATGVGTAGVGAYESNRDTTSSTDPASSTTAPHKSSLLNKLDPRVKSDKSTQPDSTGITGTPGHVGATNTGTSSQVTDKDHHYGRDAGLAGAGGVAGYEAQKSLGSHEPVGTTSSTGTSNPYSSSGLDPRVDSEHGTGRGTVGSTGEGKDHHYGRDAGLVGAGGVAAYEAEKHLGKGNKSNETSQVPESVGGLSHGRNVDPVGSGYDQTAGITSDQGKGFVGTGAGPQSGTGPHHSRDAGLTGAGLGAGSVAAYEAEKHHDRHQPTTTDPSTYSSSKHEKPTDTHTGRDAALAGGAGAGLGAAAESELSKKDLHKLEKEHTKEIEKEQKAIHKDQIKHEKEIEKEVKKHDKAIAKEEKKHDDGKKHGGILGLFHRDKPDKELKEEEIERQHATSHHGAETAAGVGTAAAVGAGVEHEKDKHERNRLHKDPPAGYLDSKKYGEEPKAGYASQVTGGTGTTALAQGDEIPGGPHLTAAGNKVDPSVPDRHELIASQTETEPHTGLPIDLSKGSGAGGTDGGTIPGYHTHDRDATGLATSTGHHTHGGDATGLATSTGGITHSSGAPSSGTSGRGGAGNDITGTEL